MQTIDHIILACEEATAAGVTNALVAVGVLPETITLAECRTLYGNSQAKELRWSPAIEWYPLGKGGTTSGVYASRREVANYFFNKTIKTIIQNENFKKERSKAKEPK